MEFETIPTTNDSCAGPEPATRLPETDDDQSKIPSWDDMPKPAPLIVLSWEDIYPYARNSARERFDRDPTKEEIREIFRMIERKGMDCEDGTFWSTVEYYTSEYYQGLTRQ